MEASASSDGCESFPRLQQFEPCGMDGALLEAIQAEAQHWQQRQDVQPFTNLAQDTFSAPAVCFDITVDDVCMDLMPDIYDVDWSADHGSNDHVALADLGGDSSKCAELDVFFGPRDLTPNPPPFGDKWGVVCLQTPPL